MFLLYPVSIDRTSPEDIAHLESLILHETIVGMELFPGHDPFYPTDSLLDPVYALCEAHQMPMMIHTGWNTGHPEVAQFNDPKYIVEIAQRYPALPIVIAHYFWPEVDYCYELTHDYPSISYDTSGLADDGLVDATGEVAIRGVLLKTLERDSRGIIFGTDYARCDLQKHIDLVHSLPVSHAIAEGVFWRNAVSLFSPPVGGG